MRYPTLAAPSFLRPVAIFAGITSVFQATIYIVLTTLGILVYQCHITFPFVESSLKRCFVDMYFHDAVTCSARKPVFESLLDPNTMYAWMISYLTIDIIWFIVSSVEIYMAFNFRKKTVLPTLLLWSIFTMGVCCMDLAATVYFAIQLQTTTYLASKLDDLAVSVNIVHTCVDMQTMLTVPGLLMSLSCRFYIFWVMNTALVVIIGVAAVGMKSKNSEDQDYLEPGFMDRTNMYSTNIDESVHSMQFARRLSVIDAWKESWRDAPPIRMPRVKTVRSSPFSYPKSNVGSPPPSSEDFASGTSSSSSSLPMDGPSRPPTPPPLPLEPQIIQSPPPQTTSPTRRRDPPPPPRRHPPPPPDQKPLRSALKSRY